MTVVPYEAERPWLALQNPALELANAIAGTDFVPAQLRNNPAAICAAILYGDEVGLGPMQSLAKIAVIQGRPTLSAEAQRALILQAGHDLWVEESTGSRCTVAGRRRGSEATSRITWTIDDAKRAGLAGKQPWKLYPRQMLLARASAELARAVFADAIGGLAATEEADDESIPANGSGPVEAAPAPTARRKRASIKAGPVGEPPSPDLPPLPDEIQVEDPADQAIPDNVPPELTKAQGTKLNVLVGKLRDSGDIETEHLWKAVAASRSFEYEQMVELLHGLDDEGVLHWAPLRDSLTRPEATELIDRLEALEQKAAA